MRVSGTDDPMHANCERNDALKRRRLCRWAAFCTTLVAVLLAASPAFAADRIYWSNLDGNSISWSNLDGSGGGDLPIDPAALNGPMGLAIDSAHGKLYWSNYGLSPAGSGTTISVANLDGSGAHVLPISGAPVNGPHGVAIDPAAGKLYWTNHQDSPYSSWIGYSNLDGSNAGFLNTGTATVDGPRGLAIDPATGRIFWANWIANRISFANLDGSGGADLNTGTATVESPEGVALSPSQNRLYYGNFTLNPDPPHETISYVNLDGSGGADLDTPGATRDEPHGIAIDPTANRIYWPNFAANIVSYANLDGSGGNDLPTPNATKIGPNLPVLFKVPAASGTPDVSGRAAPGSVLHCTQGSWAPDLIASLLYRAPQSLSYQWSENGRPIRGANSQTLKARSVGDYSCQVNASNAAGSSSESSRSSSVFEVGRARLNKRRGTALLKVRVPDRGRLSVRGKGVMRSRLQARVVGSSTGRLVGAGRVNVLVKAKGRAKKRLQRNGRARIRLKITYTPSHANGGTQARKLRLKKKIH